MADISPDVGTWSSTAGSNQPQGTTAISTGLDDNLRAIQAGLRALIEPLSSVAGTNTVTASMGGLTAYYSGLRVILTPANTNTGATTVNLNSLGAKNVFISGRALVGGELKQSLPMEIEYDGTQFNILGAVDINALTADGSPDGTADYVQTYDASTTSYKKVLLNNIGLPAATQAEQETATSTTKSVTPGRQQFHPSAAKAWLLVGGGGTPAVSASYNITSVADNGVGNTTVTIDTDFSSASYCAIAGANQSGTGARIANFDISSATAGALVVADAGGAAADPGAWYFVAYGDQ